MVNTIMEGVKAWLKTAPPLQNLGRLNVDFLPTEMGSYSVEEEPSESVIEEYLDGSSTRQFIFDVRARFIYSDEIAQNIDNLGVFEALQAWMEEQNAAGNFPELPSGCSAWKCSCTTYGYLFDVASNMGDAIYQLQCKLIYEKG